ncbi:MAG: type III pantothenate kinase [Acidimicrobiales bacterium]
MLLAIDVGNTETVIGLYTLTPQEGASFPPGDAGFGIGAERQPVHGLTHHWRLSTVPARTPDEYAVLLTQILDLEGIDIGVTVGGVAVCSSVPAVTGHLRQMAARWLGDIPCVVLGPGVRSGMPILYDSPKEVGADRVANAVGAFDLYGGPCVVVDLGTATTFDAISAGGEYLGGAITPGVAISLEALFEHAAALRRVELVEPGAVIGRSTAESIQSGVLYGFAAQVDGLCRRFLDELGPATVVATGGLSDLVAPHAESVDHVEPWLTLHGLRVVYGRNVPGPAGNAPGAAATGSVATGAAAAGSRPARSGSRPAGPGRRR